jgi:hypothetical protein
MTNRQKLPTKVEEILVRIEDPAMRAVIGTIIAERNKFRSENILLKTMTETIVDRRRVVAPPKGSPCLSGLLTEPEREALQLAISEKLFEERAWKVFPNGRVKDKHGRHLYKPGYVTAIKKILKEI